MLAIWIVSPTKWTPSCGVNKDTLARWYQKKSKKAKKIKKIKNQKIKKQKNKKNRKEKINKIEKKELVFSSLGQNVCLLSLPYS